MILNSKKTGQATFAFHTAVEIKTMKINNSAFLIPAYGFSTSSLRRTLVVDRLKSVLFVFIMLSFSLFVIGYLQNFFLFPPVALFVNSIGFGPKTVGAFLVSWLIIALPNILCGVAIGMYVPFLRQIYISPFIIILLFFVSGYLYMLSRSFIWVCDSWNLMFATAIAGFIVGIIRHKSIKSKRKLR